VHQAPKHGPGEQTGGATRPTRPVRSKGLPTARSPRRGERLQPASPAGPGRARLVGAAAVVLAGAIGLGVLLRVRADAVPGIALLQQQPTATAPAADAEIAGAPAPTARAEPAAAVQPTPIADAATPEPPRAVEPTPVAQTPTLEPAAGVEPTPIAGKATPESAAAVEPTPIAGSATPQPVAAAEPSPLAGSATPEAPTGAGPRAAVEPASAAETPTAHPEPRAIAEPTQAPTPEPEAVRPPRPVVIAPPPVAPQRRPALRTYTVQRGDLLKQIAARHGVSMASILAINDIPNPDSLRIGQVLVIPPRGS
jgi:hypothetical protein